MVETRAMAPNLDLHLPKGAHWSEATDKILDEDLKNWVMFHGLPVVLRLRMTYAARVPPPRKRLHDILDNKNFFNIGNLHGRLSSVRSIIMSAQTAACLAGKQNDYDDRMLGLSVIEVNQGAGSAGHPKTPSFLGQKARKIMKALSEDLVWNKKTDTFSMKTQGRVWILAGIYTPELEQAFMAASFFLNRELELDGQFYLSYASGLSSTSQKAMPITNIMACTLLRMWFGMICSRELPWTRLTVRPSTFVSNEALALQRVAALLVEGLLLFAVGS